jgi:hypothetical protein
MKARMARIEYEPLVETDAPDRRLDLVVATIVSRP